MIYTSIADKQTQKIASDLAKKFLKKGGIIALVGNLGAGKTTFTQGFAKGLGITDKIISPTFVLIRQHQILKSNRMLYHVDLYRLENVAEFVQIGLSELLEDKQNIVLIEWAEKIKNWLPKNTLFVNFKKLSENVRQITLFGKAT